MDKINCTNCGTENPATNKYCTNCGYTLPQAPAPAIESTPAQPDTLTAKLNKRKGLIGAIFGLIFFTLIVLFYVHLFSRLSLGEKFKASVIDKAMTALAEQTNKNCPIMIDQNTRLDNLLEMHGKVLQYNYTLLNISKADINADVLRESVQSKLVENVKSNPELQMLRAYKATFIYNYHDKNGEPLLNISVTPDMYAK